MNRNVLLFVFLAVTASAAALAIYRLSAPDEKPAAEAIASDTYSNIHPGDYVGPQACTQCHQEQNSQWEQHAHRTMNRNANDTSVLGDFSGRKVEYGNGHVLFEKRGDQFLMSLFVDEQLQREYRVTRTVGSRIEQMYIGVQTKGPEPPGDAAYSREGKLPFGFWLKRQAWLPDAYFDSDRSPEPSAPMRMTDELSQVHKTIQWGETCIYCHNTYPYQHRLFFGEGIGFPLRDIELNGGGDMLRGWGPTTPDKLVTLGISCESCHFGGREHAVEHRDSRYVPTSPQLAIHRATSPGHADDAKSAYVINSICSQCHCAKVSQYPNGAGTWNSREALDLTSGACASQLKCTDCHDPHRSRHHGGLLDQEQTLATCVRCHEQYEDPSRLAQHTRHDAESNVTCLDCHMPRIVQGLEEVVRTHHISSPTDKRMLALAAPNACNLCHLDKSVRWTLSELKKGWGRDIKIDESWNREYRGDYDRPQGHVWLSHRIPHVRLPAMAAYGRSPLGQAELPLLLQSLKDAYAVNRMFGLFAVEQVLGRRLSDDEYAPLATESRRNQQVDLLATQWERKDGAEAGEHPLKETANQK